MAVVEADSIGGVAVKGGRLVDLSGWRDALESEGQRLMVWSPLLLVTGIWTYFSLPREPPGFLALPLLVLCAVVLLLRRVPIVLRVCIIIALGFAAAEVRTHGWVQRCWAPIRRGKAYRVMWWMWMYVRSCASRFCWR